MHLACLAYFDRIRKSFPEVFKVQRVLEAGSLDMNGTVREWFPKGCEYIGLDWRPGPGVDAVALVHEWHGRRKYFDTVISTEMLEHDPYWQKSIAAMVQFVRPGGNLVITCAGPGRAAHCVDTSPGKDYYENRTIGEILALLPEFQLIQTEFENEPACDTRVLAMEKR